MLSVRNNVYLVDAVQGRVAYFSNTSPSTEWVHEWTYGSSGSGNGQFSSPSGVCVGRSAASASGSSGFGTSFYIVDAGNRRVVRLERGPTSPAWTSDTAFIPGSTGQPHGWQPTSCTVDHFGTVYVVDQQNHQLVSYTRFLDEIARYGSYGVGTTNINTFAYPHEVHVPFGERSVGGQAIWYGEGRILTAESWGPTSGGLAHWLGVEIPSASAYPSAWGPIAQFRTTGMAYLTVEVRRGTHGSDPDALINTIWDSQLLSPTWFQAEWDGRGSNGLYASPGLYHFHVRATSAYGCQTAPWCQALKITNPTSWDGPGSPGCECPPEEPCLPCEAVNVALPLHDPVLSPAIPGAFRLGQVITAYAGPLLRLEGLDASASLSATMSSAEAVASVRAQGLRALSVDVPSAGSATPVSVRLYSLTGRLVRVLVDETVQPGSYVVGWDGEDAAGRPVQPGVYIAVMTAGRYRGVQRLLIK
jgi:hypothetical protein